MPVHRFTVAFAVALCLVIPRLVTAQQMRDYRCTIERVSAAEAEKKEFLDSRAKLYVGREFTVERRTGLMSGALKNSYLTRPDVIDQGSSENSFKAVTTLRVEQGAGRGSNVYVLVVNEYRPGAKKPFLFVDNDEVYTGTCIHF